MDYEDFQPGDRVVITRAGRHDRKVGLWPGSIGIVRRRDDDPPISRDVAWLVDFPADQRRMPEDSGPMVAPDSPLHAWLMFSSQIRRIDPGRTPHEDD